MKTTKTSKTKLRPGSDGRFVRALLLRLEEEKKRHKVVDYDEFAETMGVPPSTYTNWRNKQNVPGADAIATIANRLGVTSDWLLGFSPTVDDEATKKYPREQLRPRQAPKFPGQWRTDPTLEEDVADRVLRAIERQVPEVIRVGLPIPWEAGHQYLCVTDHTSHEPPDKSFWRELTRGEQRTWRGPWSAKRDYVRNDAVEHGSAQGKALLTFLECASVAAVKKYTEWTRQKMGVLNVAIATARSTLATHAEGSRKKSAPIGAAHVLHGLRKYYDELLPPSDPVTDPYRLALVGKWTEAWDEAMKAVESEVDQVAVVPGLVKGKVRLRLLEGKESRRRRRLARALQSRAARDGAKPAEKRKARAEFAKHPAPPTRSQKK